MTRGLKWIKALSIMFLSRAGLFLGVRWLGVSIDKWIITILSFNFLGLTAGQAGAIGGGVTSFVVVAGAAAAGYTRYRRRSSDPDVLITNDQLEELDGSEESDVPLLEACGNQTSEA